MLRVRDRLALLGLLAAACGDDVATPQAERPDAAVPDAAVADSGAGGAPVQPVVARPDAAVPSAARPEAAFPDAAVHDAAVPDHGRPPVNGCDLVCEDRNGIRFQCLDVVGLEGVTTRQCVPDLRGKTYLSTRFEPVGLSASAEQRLLFWPVLSVVFNAGYRLFIVFPEEGNGQPLTSYSMDLMQGGAMAPDGSYAGDLQSSTDRSAYAVWVPATAQETEAEDPLFGIYAIAPQSGSDAPEAGEARTTMGSFRLVFPWWIGGDRCFVTSTTMINIVAMLVPTADGRTNLKSSVSMCMGVASADVEVNAGGNRVPIGTLLDATGLPRCDSNGDGDPDGWIMELAVTFKPVDFRDDPGRYNGNIPSPACR